MQVYRCEGAVDAICAYTADNGITTPVATMFVLLGHATEHGATILRCPKALGLAVAAVLVIVQLESETPAAVCSLATLFADRLRNDVQVETAHAPCDHITHGHARDGGSIRNPAHAQECMHMPLLAEDIATALELAETCMHSGEGNTAGSEGEGGSDDTGGPDREKIRAEMLRLARVWPGARHANDRRAYREVAVAPIWEELASGPGAAVTAPFLPAADGGDLFLADRVCPVYVCVWHPTHDQAYSLPAMLPARPGLPPCHHRERHHSLVVIVCSEWPGSCHAFLHLHVQPRVAGQLS